MRLKKKIVRLYELERAMSILSLTPLPSMEVSVHDKSFDAMIRDLLFTPLRLCSLWTIAFIIKIQGELCVNTSR